jgi:type I restriction enzyme M protein
MPREKKSSVKTGNGANLGFEATLWATADKMRNNMDAAEYKHVVLGLIFLTYISDDQRRACVLRRAGVER